MSKPYYEIDHETQNIIQELKKKCTELDLGNISFHYFPTKARQEETEFYLTEYKHYWELVVKQRWAKTTDIYRIEENGLNYQYSEKD
jgi:hypothetical protein